MSEGKTSRLPRLPETVEACKARFPKAVEEVYDQTAAAIGLVPPPSKQRRCVFDSTRGIRLVVSREKLLNGDIEVHVSASLWPDSLLYDELHHAAATRELDARGLFKRFADAAMQFYREISGDEADIALHAATSGGVLHWSRPESTKE